MNYLATDRVSQEVMNQIAQANIRSVRETLPGWLEALGPTPQELQSITAILSGKSQNNRYDIDNAVNSLVKQYTLNQNGYPCSLDKAIGLFQQRAKNNDPLAQAVLIGFSQRIGMQQQFPYPPQPCDPWPPSGPYGCPPQQLPYPPQPDPSIMPPSGPYGYPQQQQIPAALMPTAQETDALMSLFQPQASGKQNTQLAANALTKAMFVADPGQLIELARMLGLNSGMVRNAGGTDDPNVLQNKEVLNMVTQNLAGLHEVLTATEDVSKLDKNKLHDVLSRLCGTNDPVVLRELQQALTNMPQWQRDQLLNITATAMQRNSVFDQVVVGTMQQVSPPPAQPTPRCGTTGNSPPDYYARPNYYGSQSPLSQDQY